MGPQDRAGFGGQDPTTAVVRTASHLAILRHSTSPSFISLLSESTKSQNDVAQRSQEVHMSASSITGLHSLSSSNIPVTASGIQSLAQFLEQGGLQHLCDSLIIHDEVEASSLSTGYADPGVSKKTQQVGSRAEKSTPHLRRRNLERNEYPGICGASD